jgi:hypothetical protein
MNRIDRAPTPPDLWTEALWGAALLGSILLIVALLGGKL